MDFAPYQSSPPEHTRSPVDSPRTSLERRPWSPLRAGSGPGANSSGGGGGGYNYGQRNDSAASPPPLQHPQPQRQWSGGIPSPSYYQQAMGGSGGGGQGGGAGQDSGYFAGSSNGGGVGGGVGLSSGPWGDREGAMSEFDTSLGIRLDYEACLAYLAFPPLGAILLLILERKSDYVRFHAWQASLLFTIVFIVHLVFSWSRFLSWLFFIGDLALIAFLTLKAYRDADTLDRFEVPIFGPLASRILDDE
ncbi:hypothetical protein GGTG_10036 [Gaeumannomyces tritici R3-111a-1]|uniref:Uncharacterized protein n=1 Tax=Gaeumannomyces tritici (strain R3-111a-1) TaxID=644352 RepID=J3P952_GAET3|nr:hypothetical protein GGTG_10036 [Gaeumannomyces tritici R3-111a-1]EJT73187.1 hypothetical protein GGTG_10036 [Gaeumannomyces tritici R3-111a-1]